MSQINSDPVTGKKPLASGLLFGQKQPGHRAPAFKASLVPSHLRRAMRAVATACTAWLYSLNHGNPDNIALRLNSKLNPKGPPHLTELLPRRKIAS